ncbi:MAG: bifunctional riboflavin kinase/FAD synthetase [Crocinitomicaceae bacterium]
MKVYYSLDKVPPIKNPVITLGTFDGVHLGHQKIIDFLNESAERVGGESVLFTFHPHPRMVLHPNDHNLELIQSIDQRIISLRKAGVKHLILHPFTLEFSRMSATEFVRNILVNTLNVKVLTIGYNHHFGKNREGDIHLLKELSTVYNFEVQEIPALRLEDLSVSSTKIRTAIKEGDIKTANEFLGSVFTFKGNVVKGDKIGSQLGYPTANIGNIENTQIIPGSGVYAVKVNVEEKELSGMMNIGVRPTVTDSKERRIEVHILDFNQDLYGKEIEVKVIDRVREERTFSDTNELKEQIAKDEISCRHILDQFNIHC